MGFQPTYVGCPGRIYYIRIPSTDLCRELEKEFTKRAERAKKEAEAKSRFERNQERVAAVFNSNPFQCSVAALIFTVSARRAQINPPSRQRVGPLALTAALGTAPPAPARQNFIINAAQAQLNGQLLRDDGSLTPVGLALDRLDVAFTLLFTAELLVNAYAHWFAAFFASRYNLVDAAVIALSLVALGPINIPITVLRVIRAFRVVRVFGRLGSLRRRRPRRPAPAPARPAPAPARQVARLLPFSAIHIPQEYRKRPRPPPHHHRPPKNKLYAAHETTPTREERGKHDGEENMGAWGS